MINSFGPVYVYSLAYSLSPLFSLFSGEKKKLIPTFFGCNIPSLGPRSKQYFSACSPPPQQETQDSGWGMQAAAQIMGTVLTVSCLLQTSCSISHQSSFCPSLFPHCEWAFLSVGTSLHFQFLSRGAGTFLFPLFVFSFFHPTWLHGDSSCSFRCLIFC